jgi:transglutaminase-like putative cysteine protease/uncharacterized membrane protein YhaH (DUF805 family)
VNHRHTQGLTAAAATLLATLPLASLFLSLSWFVYGALVIAIVEGCAMLVRQARGPLWAQALAMFAGLLLFLTLRFPSGEEYVGFIPSGRTFLHFNDLLVEAGAQIRSESVPVNDFPGISLLTVLGIGMVMLLVDVAAVGLRRPALAGLPMLALYSVPVAILPNGLSFIAFLAGAIGFIWLLISDSVDRVRRFGRRFTGEGRDVDVWESSPLSSAGRRLGAIGIVVALLVPLVIPTHTPDWLSGVNGAGGENGNGNGPPNGTSVDLTGFLTGNLNRDRQFVMAKVTTNDPAPFYLRIGVADQVSLKGFTSHSVSGRSLSEIDASYAAPAMAGVTSQRYHAQVAAQDLAIQLAPLYTQLVGVSGLSDAWSYEASSGQVFSSRERISGRTYDFDFVHVNYTPEALRAVGPMPAGARPLTEVPAIESVSQKVAEITAGKTTEYDQVLAIYNFFQDPKENFRYSLQTRPGSSDAEIVNFLANREGFCVQYAAAMAWLVRVAGYPARMAFGFTRGTASGGTYTLTNFNLHSWTEVYFPQVGWVPFDATPAGVVSGTVREPWFSEPGAVTPTGAPETDNPRPQNEPTPTAPALPGSNHGGGAPTGTAISPWLVGGVALAALIVALMWVPALRRRSLRRQRRALSGDLALLDAGNRLTTARAAGPPRDVPLTDPAAIDAARRDAHAAWDELRDTMIDFQVEVDDAETPRATIERLNTLLDEVAPLVAPAPEGDIVTSGSVPRQRGGRHTAPLRDQTALLSRAEERARYAKRPLHPYGLDAAVGAVRDALVARATRWQRLSARVLPRSVLRRWHASWDGWLERGSARLTRAREALATVNPRRLLARSAR